MRARTATTQSSQSSLGAATRLLLAQGLTLSLIAVGTLHPATTAAAFQSQAVTTASFSIADLQGTIRLVALGACVRN